MGGRIFSIIGSAPQDHASGDPNALYLIKRQFGIRKSLEFKQEAT